ncbi:MAG: chorismate mutase [Corallococcus sp.]|nr:chorismate mutase [Corallococcus sp.]
MIIIRGAITCENNKESIYSQTTLLLKEILKKNCLSKDDVKGVLFTATTDLDCAYPATAARSNLQFDFVPMLCVAEMNVVGSLPNCIRVMLFAEGETKDVKHCYLGGASVLRPDLAVKCK